MSLKTSETCSVFCFQGYKERILGWNNGLTCIIINFVNQKKKALNYFYPIEIILPQECVSLPYKT